VRLPSVSVELGDEGSGKRHAALILDENGKAVAELDDQPRHHWDGELDFDKLYALTLGTLRAARVRW
jgi:hypothetical protein